MNHIEAIVELHGIVEKKFCHEIIQYINKLNLTKLKSLNEIDKDTRKVLGHSLHPEKNIFNKINKKIEFLYTFYKAKFPKINNEKINQIDLLKYEVGGKYESHVDSYTDASRSISVIINLNNEYEGGDLVFVDQKNYEIKRCKLKEGSIVFFPSNFLYPHGIEPILKGTRYSIVSWLQ